MSELLTRLRLALQDRYRLDREIGQGGMAIVYLAEDLKHHRMVALKVLRPELAAVVGAQRFLAEIKTTANLQHPHILPLYDSGEADGLLFYVMPHVVGESLRARLDRERQLPVAEAVSIAAAVAHGLDYAHRNGVIHRDIKPENILLEDGEPVIADFGIALAISAAGAGRLTETGLSLGTPYYMSPEQATGDQSVGAATDIYALGCVLYETLVGDPPYVGKTAQAILGRIITGEPEPVTERRRAVAANVDAAIRKALEKVPADRFRSAQEFATALADSAFRHGAEDGSDVPIRGRWMGRLAISGWAIAAVLALWCGLTTFLSVPPHRVARFDIELPVGHRLTGLSPSPDAGAVFYAAGELFRRTLEDLAVERIPSARAGGDLSVSPDGQWIGFTSRESGRDILRKVRSSGGPAVDLAEHPYIRGIAWDPPDHLIIGSHNEGLWRVDAGGGDLERLTDPAGGAPHRYPRVLPDRRGVLFQIGGSEIGDQVAVLPDGESVWRVLTEGSDPQYVPTGHVVFYRDGSLWAAPFDLGRLELDGEPVPVIPSIGRRDKTLFAWSADGSLFYVDPAPALEQVVVWVSREGAEQPLSIPAGDFPVPPALSPSGSMLLLTQNARIWIHELARGVSERLTGDSASEWQGIWSPSGADVYFMSRRSGPFALYSAPLRGARSIEAIGIGNAVPHDWTADGRGLIYTSRSDTMTNKLSIWRLAEGRSEILLDEPADERNVAGSVRLSPDDRYLAYETSDPSGVSHIDVYSFPNVTANRWRMPSADARQPRWSADGTELYYMVAGAVLAVSVDPANDVPFGPPVQILDGPIVHYDVAPDGRFLAIRQRDTTGGGGRDRMIVVQNWFDELRRLVPP